MTTRLLVSFAHMGKSPLETLLRFKGVDLIVDSGAFTAHKSGKPIDIDAYCEFVKAAGLKPWTYFNLDVIGNAEASGVNYKTMLRRGLQPIPVMTPGDGAKDFHRYAATAERIAVGGLVRANPRDQKSRIQAVMREAAKLKGKVRIHWLGYANTEMLKAHGPDSVDVTTWSNPARYKATLILNRQRGTLLHIPMQKLRERVLPWIEQEVRRMGFEPRQLARSDAWKGTGAAYVLAARSFVDFAREIERRIGTKVYFATLPAQAAWADLAEAEGFLNGKAASSGGVLRRSRQHDRTVLGSRPGA